MAPTHMSAVDVKDSKNQHPHLTPHFWQTEGHQRHARTGSTWPGPGALRPPAPALRPGPEGYSQRARAFPAPALRGPRRHRAVTRPTCPRPPRCAMRVWPSGLLALGRRRGGAGEPGPAPPPPTLRRRRGEGSGAADPRDSDVSGIPGAGRQLGPRKWLRVDAHGSAAYVTVSGADFSSSSARLSAEFGAQIPGLSLTD